MSHGDTLFDRAIFNLPRSSIFTMDTDSVEVNAQVLEVFPEPVEQVVIRLRRGLTADRQDAVKTNHAALFLVLAKGQRCVRLNMAYTNFGAILMVDAHEYKMSPTVLQSYPLLAAKGARVQDFWQAIEQDRLHLFQYEVLKSDKHDDEAYGCRNWVYVNPLR